MPCHRSPPLAHKDVEVPPMPSPRAAAPVEALRNTSRFDSYSLDTAECSAEFKDLFKEIERAAAHRNTIGNVTKADISLDWIEDGAVRAMIYRQKVQNLQRHISIMNYDSPATSSSS
jgi:hypothetical protein